ncbi:MAG: molybdopterin containing oxidoreductase [Thalassobius sp.]|nr:molybdopterin containing oxidoreductase [Thalassovita sp.]
MKKKKNFKGIHELYAQDPVKADELLWGRKQKQLTPKDKFLSRRGFISKAALSTMAAFLGGKIVFAENMPIGLIPAALANSKKPFEIPGKDPELVVLNDRPWNAEAPPHLLDDKLTPGDKFFVRNNGLVPENIDVANWTLTIDGESVKESKTFTLQELKSKFKQYTYELTLECGGNGRSEYNPPAKGNQWTTGAVGCASFTGVRLKDVLEDCGIKDDAVYIGYYGKDVHLSGDPKKVVISRGVPMWKALQEESLIAWSMNGEDLPVMNGYPLRLVFGGWPASTSGKWLSKISIRNIVHDGPKMTGMSYKVPCKTVAPGTEVAEEDMCIIESMPVKSLITYPRSGAMISKSKKLSVRGHAWAGENDVSEMHYSIDFGATWKTCKLEKPNNKFAWQHWNAEIEFPEKGYYEVWAKATDSEGKMQPMVVPGWNPRGYLNNACHRIAVKVRD